LSALSQNNTGWRLHAECKDLPNASRHHPIQITVTIWLYTDFIGYGTLLCTVCQTSL